VVIQSDACVGQVKVKIVFRADASLQIGSGHVMRCLTLAEALANEGHLCHFICRALDGNLSSLIKDQGHELTMLPAPYEQTEQSPTSQPDDYQQWLGVSWQEDASQTLDRVVSSLTPEWLVVDHYGLDVRWEGEISSFVEKIMVIDDLANRSHKCNVLLDQNLGRRYEDYDTLVPADCRRLIGPSFALLRPEFRMLRETSLARRDASNIRQILISLGGVDRLNLTEEILKILAEIPLPEETALDVVMGTSAPHLDAVRHQASMMPYAVTVSASVNNMAERMQQADLSIGAAGGMSWERCCLGLPSIVVVLAENQLKVAQALRTAGAAAVVENPRHLKTELPILMNILGEADNLKLLSEQASQLSYGDGCQNVINIMNGS